MTKNTCSWWHWFIYNLIHGCVFFFFKKRLHVYDQGIPEISIHIFESVRYNYNILFTVNFCTTLSYMLTQTFFFWINSMKHESLSLKYIHFKTWIYTLGISGVTHGYFHMDKNVLLYCNSELWVKTTVMHYFGASDNYFGHM